MMRPGIILFVALISLASAYIAEYVFGLKPCILCLYERIPYFLAALVAIIMLIYKKNLNKLFLLIFVASSVLSFYHVGVEQHFFAGTSKCNSQFTGATSIEELRSQMLNQPPSCAKAEFIFLGISLAGWNLLLSLFLSIATIIGIRNEKNKTSGRPPN